MISYNNPVNMGSSLVINVVVKDELGVTVLPATTAWSLVNEHGGIENYRENVELTPSRSMTINLTRFDTALPGGTEYATRTVKVVSTYVNKTGDTLDVVDRLSFQIHKV